MNEKGSDQMLAPDQSKSERQLYGIVKDDKSSPL
jgi:hypothetical protein